MEEGSSGEITVEQNKLFFGVDNKSCPHINIVALLELPRITTRKITFDQEKCDFPWPQAGVTHIERILAIIGMGGGPVTIQYLANMLKGIFKKEVIHVERTDWVRVNLKKELMYTASNILPIYKRFLKSGIVHEDYFNSQKTGIYDIPENKGNELAKAIAIAEAYLSLWKHYGVRLNNFILGGEHGRKTTFGKLSPYMITETLSKLEKAGEYLVRDIFPIEKFTNDGTAASIVRHLSYTKLEDGSQIAEYLPAEEGYILITPRNLAEYKILQDNGYFDGKPTTILLILKGEVRKNGKLNIRSIMVHSIAKLQNEYPDGIPVGELDRVARERIVELTGKKYSGKALDFNFFKYEYSNGKGNPDEVGNVIDGKLVLTAPIAIIEDTPLASYPSYSNPEKPLHHTVEFRKRVVKYWKEIGGKPDTRIPLSKLGYIYSKLMEERGKKLSLKDITTGTRRLALGFKLFPEKEPRIRISEKQLAIVKHIFTILENVPKRYRQLIGTEIGRQYIINLFGNDIDHEGNRMPIKDIPAVRKEMLKTLFRMYASLRIYNSTKLDEV
ncbi:MAG: hypothetical protein WCO33_01050 [bacterium]